MFSKLLSRLYFENRSRFLLIQIMSTNKEGEQMLTTLASVPIVIDHGEYGKPFILAGSVNGEKVSPT